MNEREINLMEAELQKMRPGKPPAAFLARLAVTAAQVEHAAVQDRRSGFQASRPASYSSPALLANERLARTADQNVPSGLNGQAASPDRPKRSPIAGFFCRIGAPWRLPGWFAATAASALVCALAGWWAVDRNRPHSSRRLGGLARTVLKADHVEIGQNLVGSFDAVARLPSGTPVRFRCRQWTDKVLVRDSARGVVIEQQTPRLEIVPVCFETY